MSLADQQWCPTSVQVTVLQARGLRTKGKNGTNDAYAVMQVGKEKYQTSVVEKSVAPVWKEEAAFDLPPLHFGGGGGGGGGAERGTLHVHVLHRALVGPDKQLGQAVINLLQLSEDKTRNKTEWFKLLDKVGKADKDRGEVLVDIQFMRNNMTASMFDLSAAGKSRSRLGKFKDKVRGKKKESDTVSSVVPSFSQVLTDSEDEANGDGNVAAGKDEKKKKKHKIKSLFSPKSNLQRNMSQSMSVLPAKNSSLSGSQSSGLNVDSSEGKKKFKFMIHKRSGSSDSKDSSAGQKHGAVEQSNLCINGSHVYCEEPQPRTSRIGSNFSLASSGHGSMEDVPESSPPSVDSLRGVRQYSPWTEEEEEKRRREEEEKRRIEEEERIRRVEKAERERKEEETRKLEKEKLARDAEERKTRENKTKDGHKSEVGVARTADVTSSNPFDENFLNNPFEEIPNSRAGPDSGAATASNVQQGCQSAVSSVRSRTVSTDEKDLISAQREKRPAPQPPGRSQAESQREQDVATRHLAQMNKQSNDKDIKTASVLPQRATQMIAPLSQSPADTTNTQSEMQSSSTKGTASVAKHSKRPAPSRPRSVEEEPSSEPKTANNTQRGGSETKHVPVVYGSNPFEDDEDELTAEDDAKTPGSSGSVHWPPAVSQAADKDAASQAKLKSSKVARAPPPPAKKAATSSTLIHQNTDGGHVTDDADAAVPDNGAHQACDPQPEAVISVPDQGASRKEPQPGRAQEVPSTTSRRLQPVKPLNPPDQQSVSNVQGGKYNQPTGILSEVQEKTKVNDTGLKGPYSQLTREELISLVLKQEKQLTERDKKISELEKYIDNLLVRVMEEKPSILMSMSSLMKGV
uniref:Calponin homology domain-containing protein DDB_G0272472-like n=1 Tax=Seriola dumerili TaxID=41447 RepID=A0A3B4V1C6_SERDU